MENFSGISWITFNQKNFIHLKGTVLIGNLEYSYNKNPYIAFNLYNMFIDN